jgi:ABC-type nickel/cobalt efflux system permease component RcnA
MDWLLYFCGYLLLGVVLELLASRALGQRTERPRMEALSSVLIWLLWPVLFWKALMRKRR